MAFNRVNKEIVEVFNGIWKILIKSRRKKMAISIIRSA